MTAQGGPAPARLLAVWCADWPVVALRNCAGWPGLSNCLRVTVGTSEENQRFLSALGDVLR